MLLYQELLTTIEKALTNSSKPYKGVCNVSEVGKFFLTSYVLYFCIAAELTCSALTILQDNLEKLKHSQSSFHSDCYEALESLLDFSTCSYRAAPNY